MVDLVPQSTVARLIWRALYNARVVDEQGNQGTLDAGGGVAGTTSMMPCR